MVVGNVDVEEEEAGEWAVTCVLSSPYFIAINGSTDTSFDWPSG
jgi:hypothetical protein